MIPRPLPALESYSTEQWTLAQSRSSAIARYRHLLQQKPTDFADQLRRDRHLHWLQAAMATLLGTSAAENICWQWSTAADQLLNRAWQESGCAGRAMALFALGKLGARELNLSSDVDVLVISSQAAVEEDLLALKRFRQLLMDPRDFGFCLRVDFDLRPGGRFGPLISSLSQAEDYYWSQGETWERLAFVRLRPIGGSQSVIDAFLELTRRYCYRKFLDFTLFSDLKDLRGKIQAHISTSQDARIQLKLAVGGIRDVELFVHALQIIHGGKDTSLRTGSTGLAIEKLTAAGVLPQANAQTLASAYWSLRQLENEVQAADDQQTHWLDSAPPQVRATLESVDALVSELLGRAGASSSQLPATTTAQIQWLIGLGYSETLVADVWPQLIEASALSHKKDRDERARQDFLYRFLTELAKLGGDKASAMTLLVEFVRSIRAKATFFSLLTTEVRLVRDLARLFSLSPYLGGILVSRPELIDSFILRSQGAWPEATDELLEALVERRLLTELTAANQFLSDGQLEPLLKNLSWTADEIVTALLQHLRREFSSSQLAVVALGKWGGQELGLRSDLDMVFVTPQSPSEEDYRLAKRITSRLTELHRGGRIYAVDMRLRPSGKGGPMIVPLNNLEEFLAHEAAAWERQSYSRARPLDPQLHLNLYKMRSKGLSPQDLDELADIRKRLIVGERSARKIDLKLAPAGLTELELCVQTALLHHRIDKASGNTGEQLRALGSAHPALQKDAEILRENYGRLRKIEQVLQLVSTHEGSILTFESSLAPQVAHLLRLSLSQLQSELNSLFETNLQLVKRLDPIYSRG